MSKDARADLGAMVRLWRKSRDPRLVPGYRPGRHRRTYLTQLDMATLLDIGERWYRALEAGEPRHYQRGMIDGVVRILDLGEDEAAVLYRGTGHTPPRRHQQEQPDPVLLELMHQQRCISYVTSQAWDVLAVNAVGARHCPWLDRLGANVLIWAFSPDARYQMRDWETRWAPPMLHELRRAWHRWPDDARLGQVVTEVRSLPGVAELWQRASAGSGHAPGDPRPLYLPLASPEPVDVRVAVYGRYGDVSIRWTMIVPVAPDIRLC